jgi:hypothetical protein
LEIATQTERTETYVDHRCRDGDSCQGRTKLKRKIADRRQLAHSAVLKDDTGQIRSRERAVAYHSQRLGEADGLQRRLLEGALSYGLQSTPSLEVDDPQIGAIIERPISDGGN